MSVAVIQGASGGLGSAFTRHLLRNTSLKAYAITHRSKSELGWNPHEDLTQGQRDRLIMLDGVDSTQEEALVKVQKEVSDREGNGSVRLIACFAGVLHPEKSLGAIDPLQVMQSFQTNSISHLLMYKHFVPLMPTRKNLQELRKKWDDDDEEDPAKGLISTENSLCFSLSARVGSIEDNGKGGWYSYRASKAALNQIIRTLDHELVNKSSSALAIGYHPGTVLTSFTRPILGQNAKPDLELGRLSVDQAIDHMADVMSRANRSGEKEWGGRVWDWRGDRVPW